MISIFIILLASIITLYFLIIIFDITYDIFYRFVILNSKNLFFLLFLCLKVCKWCKSILYNINPYAKNNPTFLCIKILILHNLQVIKIH